MKNSKTVTAIVLIAGNSTRYGQGRNKNLEVVHQKPIFLYSIKAFDKNEYIDNIIVAVKKDEIDSVKEVLSEEKFNKDIKIVVGGQERKDSVYNSITSTDSDIVIIQDGARPVIKQDYIKKCIDSMDEFQGVTIGVKSKDTIKITDNNNVVIDTTKRSNTWVIQTPQCFDRNVLVNMHEKYKTSEVTDDCMLLEKDKYNVKIIEGDYTNIKITTYEDLGIIKNFLEKN